MGTGGDVGAGDGSEVSAGFCSVSCAATLLKRIFCFGSLILTFEISGLRVFFGFSCGIVSRIADIFSTVSVRELLIAVQDSILSQSFILVDISIRV